jgi:hypothetical protein
MGGDQRDKGQWAETADEGIVPNALGGSDDDAITGRTTGSEEPATEEGIDREAGDEADATTHGGPDVPEDAEPDLKDVGAAQRDAER